MRLWHAGLFLLIACGGKIATESTTGAGTKTPDQDDDDFTTGSVSSSSSGGSSGVSTSGTYGTSSGYASSGYASSGYASSGYASSGYASSGYGTTSGYPYPSSSSSSGYASSSGYPYPSSSSSSSGYYPLCSDLPNGCSGGQGAWKCYVGSSPSLSCYGDFKDNIAHCSCYGYGYGDGGVSTFDFPVTSYEPKMLINVWQKYCGGYCY